MDLRRGKQAPMDLSDSGVRKHASLMDIDDTPTHITPDISNVEMEDVADESKQTHTHSHVPQSAAPVHASTMREPTDIPAEPAPALRMADIQSFKNGEPAPPARTAPEPRLRRMQSRGILKRPDVLLGYAQVIFNASVLIVVLYVIFSVLWTVRKDVAEKVRDYELEYLTDIARCEQAYRANNCGTTHQAPALADACDSWLRCSQRSHTTVGHARIFAETIAEILNGFVDAVSWKTMVRCYLQLFFVLMVSMFVGAANSTFSFFRGATRPAEPAPIPPHMVYGNMYTPYAVTSGWDTAQAPRLRIRSDESE